MRRDIIYILLGTMAILIGSVCLRLGQLLDGVFFYFGFLFAPMGAAFLAIGIVMLALSEDETPTELNTKDKRLKGE